MRQLEVDTLADQNIDAELEIGSLTLAADRELAVEIFANNVDGNGSYIVRVARQIAGAGALYSAEEITYAVPAGRTAVWFSISKIRGLSTDVLEVYLTGLAGDNDNTVDTRVEWWADDAAKPTTADRTIDVDANGGVEVGSFQAGAITAAAIATGALDADALAADAVDEILDEVVEGTITLRQAIKLLLAFTTGEATGGGTGTVTFRDIGDTKARITMTVDATGNRSAVVRDGT